MIITSINSRFVKFHPENEREKKLVHSFPGFIKIGLEYVAKAKPHVVTNLVERLRQKKVNLNMDQTVHSLVTNTFRLKPIPEDFKFFTEPLKHQNIALRFAYTVGSFGLLLEPGMGKTKVILDYIALMGFNKVLVICPKALLFVWEDEVKDHRPDKTIYCLKSTDWEKEKNEALAADILVVNYAKAVILEEQLNVVAWQFITVDEGLIKDPTTQRTKSITNLGYKTEHKAIMSGTLVNNTPLDVFAPVRFLEPSLTGGSFAKFKDEYCIMAKGGKSEAGNDMKFVVGYRKPKEIKEILHSCSIVMTKAEWLKDLPAKNYRTIIVQMHDEQRRIFEELQSNYVTEVNGVYVEIDNPLVALCKLMQVSNGFLYLNDNDAEEMEWLNGVEKKEKKKKKSKARDVFYFEHQPKLNKLVDLLKGELSNRRVILWYNYYGEKVLIEQRLTDEKISFITIAGGEKDTGGKVRQFNTDNGVQVLLCQSKAVNYGVTVLGYDLDSDDIQILPGVDTNVFTEIFYSQSFSLETYLQQCDRIHRIGQKHSCDYIHLISNSTVEYQIVEALKGKMELRTEFLEDIINKGGFYEQEG